MPEVKGVGWIWNSRVSYCLGFERSQKARVHIHDNCVYIYIYDCVMTKKGVSIVSLESVFFSEI